MPQIELTVGTTNDEVRNVGITATPDGGFILSWEVTSATYPSASETAYLQRYDQTVNGSRCVRITVLGQLVGPKRWIRAKRRSGGRWPNVGSVVPGHDSDQV